MSSPTPPPRITLAVWLPSRVPAFAFQPRHAARLRRELPGVSVRVCQSSTTLRQALRHAQIAVVWRFEQAWLDAAPQLRWIATPAAGRDYFHVTPPAGRALDVTYGSFHGQIIAETVAAWVLALNRGVLDAARLQERGEIWPQSELAPLQRTIRGTEAVIVGFGHIGEWIGRSLKPFGVRITGVRRHLPRRRPDWFERGDRIVSMAQLDAALTEADHLILALPGGPATDRLIDGRRLARLGPQAAVYNVGRGNAIDEAALAAALKAGRLRAACLDVFGTEPLPPDAPLLRAPNVFLLPHLSAAAPAYLDLFLDEFVRIFPANLLC
jgi:phosphoglycerate dehydrogenase-like enzyme